MSTADTRPSDETIDAAYGVSIFAGVLLATMAAFEILQGLAAVLEDDVYVSGINYIYEVDISAWGWWHLLIGVLAVVAGVGIIKGQAWAYFAGMGFAVISAVGQFMFMPYYPFWAIAIIALDVLVIWALSKQLART